MEELVDEVEVAFLYHVFVIEIMIAYYTQGSSCDHAVASWYLHAHLPTSPHVVHYLHAFVKGKERDLGLPVYRLEKKGQSS
mgnify:FL=1